MMVARDFISWIDLVYGDSLFRSQSVSSARKNKSGLPRAMSPAASRKREQQQDIQSLLGKPLLLQGEDPVAYDQLFSALVKTFEPANALEQIWMRDLAEAIWDLERLRRAKTSLLRSSSYKGVEELLMPRIDTLTIDALVAGYANREAWALQKVAESLTTAGLDESAITAQTLAVKIREIEAIDFLITRAEARRMAAIRDIERHREVIGRFAPKKPLEDISYKELEE
jgi:hypothetical protein